MKRETEAKQTPAHICFEVRHAGQSKKLSYQQLFTEGYVNWLAKRYSDASKIFEALTAVKDRGPRAHIMLSHCKAMLGDYGGCAATLSEKLSAEEFNEAATDLHNVFVMWKCGFFHDVKTGLEKVISEQDALPTPCLILADLKMQSGGSSQCSQLLQLAIKRDRPEGAIATIARRKLDSMRSRPSTRASVKDSSNKSANL